MGGFKSCAQCRISSESCERAYSTLRGAIYGRLAEMVRIILTKEGTVRATLAGLLGGGPVGKLSWNPQLPVPVVALGAELIYAVRSTAG